MTATTRICSSPVRPPGRLQGCGHRPGQHQQQGVGPLVVTQDFGSQPGEGPQILGVVYNDPNHTGFYAPGEGQSGVTIDALNLATRQNYQIQTEGAGGYQIPVAPNAYYKVTAIQNGQVISSQQVYVSDENEKVNFSQVASPADATDPDHPACSRPGRLLAARSATGLHAAGSRPPSPPAPAPAPVTPPPAPVTPPPAPVTPPPAPVTPPPAQQARPVAPPDAAPALPSQPSWLAKWSRWTALDGSGH